MEKQNLFCTFKGCHYKLLIKQAQTSLIVPLQPLHSHEEIDPHIMAMKGVGTSLGPQLIAETFSFSQGTSVDSVKIREVMNKKVFQLPGSSS